MFSYKRGTPDHDAFLKLVGNTKLLVITMIATLLSAVSLIFNVIAVLNEPSSHSVLIVAPIAVVAIFILAVKIVPRLLGKGK